MPALLSERVLPVARVRRWADAGRVFAVLDACGVPAIPARARELGEAAAVSLYKGRAEEELWGIAPYLFHLDLETWDWIVETLWATPWGILAVADLDLDRMRSHFRRFLVVESPAGEAWYFRFYDPRVLPGFLAASTDEQLAELFGPVRAYGTTDPASYGVRLHVREAPPAEGDTQRITNVKVTRR